MAVDILFERIKAGDVINTFNNHLTFTDESGNEVDAPVVSNTVITHTSEEPKAPEPAKPTKETPVRAASILSKTGETESILSLMGGLMLSGLELVRILKSSILWYNTIVY
ncbi:hypothetical protein [Streptococcus respiraculi]|uniref:hypothetical protein n=1 Tax=Streptococcus respiraculi TaxID=2021971 RepID=UPI000E743175|nr:hypothetical protein [Streptococcus respiraculi]